MKGTTWKAGQASWNTADPLREDCGSTADPLGEDRGSTADAMWENCGPAADVTPECTPGPPYKHELP